MDPRHLTEQNFEADFPDFGSRNLTPGGISETSGFTLGYPVIPGTSLRSCGTGLGKSPGHHGFMASTPKSPTDALALGQHARSRRACGGEGAGQRQRIIGVGIPLESWSVCHWF